MRRRGQAGETLVEILVSTTLLGIIGIGIIGAIASVLISTDIDRKASEAETIIRSYASAITRADYQPCPGAKYLPSDVGFDIARTPRYAATIVSVESWLGTGPTVVATVTPSTAPVSELPFGSCTTGSDHGLQRLELRVDAVGGRGSEHLTLLKRDPALTTTTSGP
jgi:hypothetical protein